MKILFLTYDFPYPLNAGGKIRAYYLLKNLARRHKITLFSYYRKEEQKKYLPELEKYCQKVLLFKRRPPWSWQNLWRCFSTSLPFAAAIYYSKDLEKSLIEELKNKAYDLVHFESFYPALYLPLVKKLGVKTLFGNENLEYKIYARYVSQKPFGFRQLLELEVLKMRRFEEKLWRWADVNIVPSSTEAGIIEKATGKACSVIPNGVDFKLFKTPSPSGQNRLIFIGTLIYQANNDAMKYFLEEIYSKIKRNFPKVKFLLVSWHKPDWLEKYLSDSTIEFIQDKKTLSFELLKMAEVLIAPMRIAGGTRIKILEAMAAGLPVVTTSVGIEGIEAKNGKEVIVVDKPEDFSEQVVNLLTNKQRREELGLVGRKLVEEKYDWTKIAKKLDLIYRGLNENRD